MTTRALHLIDPVSAGWPACDALGTLLSRSAPGLEHEVVVVGGTPDMIAADRLSLPWSENIGAPLRKPWLGAPRLKARLGGPRTPDVVCAWSSGTLALAHLGARGFARFAMLSEPPPGLSAWSPERRLYRNAIGGAERLVFSTRFARSSWLAFGLPPGPTSVVPAPIDLSRIDRGSRRGIRDEWGVEERTGVILALGEPGACVQGQRSVYHAGIATLAGAINALVLPPDAWQLDRALRFTERHTGWWRLIIDERPPWKLLSACDAALWFGPARTPQGHSLRGPMSGVTGVAWAAASGCPVIAESHEMVLETLADGPVVHLCRTGDRIGVCGALLEALTPLNARRPVAPEFDSALAARHDPGAFAQRLSAEVLAACGHGVAPKTAAGTMGARVPIGESKPLAPVGGGAPRPTAPAGARP